MKTVRLRVESYWAMHARESGRETVRDYERPIDARRCTVQLSTGRLYLDAAASPATSLLGHDAPPLFPADQEAVGRMISSLAPGYYCAATTSSFAAAADLAMQLSLAAGSDRVEVNAAAGEPAWCGDLLVAYENETLGRTGRWLASSAWRRAPDLVVVGEALALGEPFGAVLVRHGFHSNAAEAVQTASDAALQRVATAIHTVEGEGLLQQGEEVAGYLLERLVSTRNSCPEIESVAGTGLSVRIVFRPAFAENPSIDRKSDRLPFTTSQGKKAALQVRRRMCERGVLVGVDADGRLTIDPPLPLRIAEADVITGALRGALLGLPMVSAPVCCAACENST